MKQRIALWGTLAAIVIGAGALVVTIGGGDGGDDPPALPLAAGGSAGGDERAASVAPDIMLASVYVPGDDLPALGGDAPAYRLVGEVTGDDVRALADALGIEGEATETDGSWHVDDGERALDVYGPDGAWTAYRTVVDAAPPPDAATGTGTAAGGGSSGSAGSAGGAGSGGSRSAVTSAPAAAPAAATQSCPGTDPGADNVVDLCEPPVCPTGPTSDPAGGCVPVCLDQPDVANDAKPCDPLLCPQYEQGAAVRTTDPDDPCRAPACPGNAADDLRCIPPSTTPPGPAEPVPDPQPVEPAPQPVPPANLPGEDEAKEIALDLLAATGADVDDATVTAENLVGMWSITVEPVVDGRAAPGLALYVGVGPEGRIESATGQLTEPDELGDYPLIDTRAALTRLNEGWGFASPLRDVTAADAAESSTGAASNEPAVEAEPGDQGDDGAADGIVGSAVPETVPAPGGEPDVSIPPPPPAAGDTPAEPQPDPVPLPEPVPTEVEVTDADVVLVTVPSWDGSGTYLVPGYRFTAADGSQPTVPAVTDDVLEPPPAPGDGDGDGDGDTPVSSAVEVQPLPAPAPGLQDGDVVAVTLYHCGFEELRLADRRWVVPEPPFDATNAPPEFVGDGTLVVQDGGAKAVYTDESGIAVTFTAVDDDWAFPPCD